MPPLYWFVVSVTDSCADFTASACTRASSSRMRSAARLSSTPWNAVSTVWRYAATLASQAARAWSVCPRRRPPSNTSSEIDGPADQKRLGHVNHWDTLELSKPPDAPSVTIGEYAGRAT